MPGTVLLKDTGHWMAPWDSGWVHCRWVFGGANRSCRGWEFPKAFWLNKR